MNDNQLMHAMSLDDTYRVEQVLARGEDGITELVTIDGAGPFVRKKIRQELARRNVWSALTECSSPRLPRVEATYELPEHFVVVYDFVPGRSPSKVIETDGPLTPEEATSLGIELCEAAEELHRHGIVHRDISPQQYRGCRKRRAPHRPWHCPHARRRDKQGYDLPRNLGVRLARTIRLCPDRRAK